MKSSINLTNSLIPLLFVFLWSTGFIGAKFGLPYAEPLTFLFVRMLIAASLLYIAALVLREQWPTKLRDYANSALVGLLIHGVYLGGVFYAISIGVEAGTSALIVSLQPLLTVTLAAMFLAEKVTPGKAAGIAAGLVGVVLVVFDSGLGVGQSASLGLIVCVFSLLGISIGTIYQKRYCTAIPMLPGVCIQYTANTIFFLILATQLETMQIQWSGEFMFALGWLVLVLSFGAVFLLLWLINRGDAGQVASLFYLVPPFTAVEAWLLFGESLTLIAVVGMFLCAVGVALVIRESATAEQQK